MIAIPDKGAKRSLGATVPDPSKLRLKDIIKTLPRECFQKDMRKAWTSVVVSLVAAAVGYAAIVASPWYLLPFSWFFTGTALTGWFVIGHDCGHRSFSKSRWVNDWIGHFFFAPLIFPFHPWRIHHDHHHLHTNKMHVDNAWHPWTEKLYIDAGPTMKVVYEMFRGRLWWLASIIHWVQLHFNPSNVKLRYRKQAKISVAVVFAFAATVWPMLLWTGGIWGFVKFWLVPWLVYHFWMSTFTLVHHTASDIQFHNASDWDAVEAQLDGTVHCEYPRWIEFLCHDISVHVPHHISVGIPSYNLRMAHDSLKQTWGERIKERRFSWQLIREIVDHCHVFHPEEAYRSCQTVKQAWAESELQG
ncbi:MAG: fatty acid desaturase [Cyanobacteria bacterium P01_F01_bin.42]